MTNSTLIQPAVRASAVLTTSDINMRPQHDVCKVVAGFLAVGESVVAHWVEFSKGLLLFVMVPGDDRSGEFYVYDRKRGIFWLLNLEDKVCGGYSIADMRRKIRDFRLLDYAQDPGRLKGRVC